MKNGTCCDVSKSTCENEHSAKFRPSVDIVETSDEFQIVADIPGAQKDGIEIRYEEGTVIIDAQAADRAPSGAKMLLREYGVGDFHRSFKVSETIDSSRISADFKDGVLVLHLPKLEAAKSRRIPVVSI